MTDEQKKRPYTLSPAALAQRREASKAGAEAATGPRTEAGKAISSRNNWKTGEYSLINRQGLSWMELSQIKSFGRPCRTTCRKYPCSLVEEGLTDTGGDCLDKSVYVEAFNSIILALQEDPDHAGVSLMLSAQMAGAIEVLQQIREELGEKGIVTLQPYVDKQGNLVVDPDTGQVAGKYVANPALPQYIKLLDALGINLPELMATPKAVEGAKRGEEQEDTMRQFLDGISRVGSGQRPPRIFDADDTEDAEGVEEVG